MELTLAPLPSEVVPVEKLIPAWRSETRRRISCSALSRSER